jgi:RimJ/RimL family protein N-acetyltransferase
MRHGDAGLIVAGRDDVSRRFLGEGDPDPQPRAVISVAGVVIGWVDHDDDRSWLQPGECNVGYHVFAPHRGRGHASRAVQLLMHLLALEGRFTTATLLIDAGNERSQALARRLGYGRVPDLDGNAYFKVAVPSLTPTDGEVTIRRLRADDLEMDLAAKDEEQIRWMWLPGQREGWAAMSAAEKEEHARQGLEERHRNFGHGPRWAFAVDHHGDARTGPTAYVAYVELDLANDDVPAGNANLSYSCHPGYRGRGITTRAARLAIGFLRDHTAATEAHIVVDVENLPSLGVARALDGTPVETIEVRGRPMRRHVISIRRGSVV